MFFWRKKQTVLLSLDCDCTVIASSTMAVQLKPVDAVIFYGVCIFFILLGLSHYFLSFVENRVKNTAHNFLTASSDHGSFKSALSIFANTLSAWILVRLPVYVYYVGPQMWISVLNLVLAVSFANYVVVPVFMKLPVKTALQYVEDRFGHTVFVFAIICQALESLLFMALWLAVPIGTLSDLTGLSFMWTVIVASVIVTIITAVGGMRAIILIDMFHLIIISAANLIIVIKGSTIMGGFDGVIKSNAKNGREYFVGDMDPFTRKNTSWLILLGYLSFGILNYSFNQAILDKYLPSSNVQKARSILWYQIPLMGSFYVIAIFLGLNIYSFYQGCDPVLTKRASTPDEILSTYVSDVAGHVPGIIGIFSVSLLSGALSTTASNLNGLTSIVNQHFIKGHPKIHDILEKKWHMMGWVTTAISVVCLPIVVGIVLADKQIQGNVINPISILNVMKTPAFGVYLLGFFNKRSTGKGALIGLIIGTLAGISLVIANFVESVPDPPPLGATVHKCKMPYCLVNHGLNESRCFMDEQILDKNVSFLLFYPPPYKHAGQEANTVLNYSLGGIITCIITFVVGSIASLFTHQSVKQKQDNLKYLAPFMRSKEKITKQKSK